MKRFTIEPNEFLEKPIQAFYHSDYYAGGNWKIDGTVENIICTLKNDINPYLDHILAIAVKRLSDILLQDLPKILQTTGLQNLTVCVVPRAKLENYYKPEQLRFRATVKSVVERLDGFVDGTSFILRHTNTRTTHRNKRGYGGDGDMPYPGITKNTCKISHKVIGQDILLIDDLYTSGVNVDEDALQALLDKGARNLFFYSVGKTVKYRNRYFMIEDDLDVEEDNDIPF